MTAKAVPKSNGVTIDAGTRTLTAGAGAAIKVVRSQASDAGFCVVGLDDKHDATDVRSVIANGEISRRALCGIEAVLTNGNHVGSGLRLQKDVCGYDLVGLLLGSGGHFGEVVSATFRLEPVGANSPGGCAWGSVPADERLVAAFDPPQA